MERDPTELARARMNRIAWTVLLTSFALFLALVIGIPLGLRAYRLHATQPLYLIIRPTQGTLALQPGPRSQTLLVKQGYEGLPKDSVVELGSEQSAVLMAYVQEGAARPLATLRLYGPLKLTLSEAERPRFASSPDAVHLHLEVAYGRLTLIADPQQHPLELNITTPQGTAQLENGTALLSVSSQSTRLDVYSGGAVVSTRNALQPLSAGARAILNQNAHISTENLGVNLARNGDFTAAFGDWEAYTRRVEPSGAGGATLSVNTPRATLRVWRAASGVAESGLTQPLNGHSTALATDIQLKALVRIAQQEIPVCGPKGDRCPLTLRLYYRDVHDVAHVWEQGFYAVGGESPKSCLTCELPNELRAIPLGEWVFYESPDLLRLTPAPAYLDALEIAAGGSRFEVECDDLILLLKE